MFERFTEDARQVVVRAQEEARRLHSHHIGTEHLLLGLVGQGGTPVADVLARHGLTRATTLDAIARFSGAALDAVRSRVESAFGPGALDDPSRLRGATAAGHIPFTPRAKKVLELSLREALALRHRHIADGHITLGLLREGEGLAMKVLADLGVETEALRRDVRAALTS